MAPSRKILPSISGASAVVRPTAPHFYGEHNDYFFGEVLGLSVKERERLAEAGVFE